MPQTNVHNAKQRISCECREYSRNSNVFVVSHRERGIATLPTILALMVLILAVGVGITGLAFIETLISAGQVQSSQSLLYAEAGARDALMRIARGKDYICTAADCYSIDMVASGCSTNDGCAKISVSAGTGTSIDPKIITSKGQVKKTTRRVQVDVVYDAGLNGEIASITWKELTN